MTNRVFAALLLLLVTSSVTAQQERELLREVGRDQAKRLEEYNSVFLQKELYFAKRHRIVTVELSVLLAERNITVTPFEDVAPIEVAYENLTRPDESAIFWRGHFVFPEDDQLFKQTGVGVPAKIAMFSWDLDEEGNALNSAENRFEFPPDLTFDEAGNPVPSDGVIAGTPRPRTPAEIETHMRLKKLDKHAFYAAEALLSAPGQSTYVMKPLQYTPRYSVIYEIAPDTAIPQRIDGTPGAPDTRAASEVAIFNRYRSFIDSLPKEEGKVIRGDVQ